MSQPFISIITINYNNKEGLARTIETVIKQTVSNYEYIIIDGGSTDGSTDIIREQQAKLTWWVSEKDKGIYDAMNKGIQKASGNYLLFLNSGDSFATTTVLATFAEALSGNQYDIIYGNAIVNKTIRYNPFPLSIFNILTYGICHQALFLKKELFAKAGLYDTSYKIVADSCHLMLCVVRHNATSFYIDNIIAELEPDGTSTVSITENRKERQRFMNKELPAIAADYEKLLAYYKKDYLQRAKKFIKRKFKGNKI